jgi:hypothetical protein
MSINKKVPEMKHYLLLSLIMPALFITSGVSQVTEQDSLALVALYHSTNGPDWIVDSNWLSDKPVTQWHGVREQNGRVIELYLWENNLTGSLPEALGDLTALVRLDLWVNALSGTLPASMGNLTMLTHLAIESNDLSGTFPPEFANCQSLQTVVAFRNDFEGSFPQPLLQLATLRRLELGNNMFTGPLPAELSQMTELRTLGLDGNQFTGELPSLKTLTNLTELFISNNSLSGDISDFLGDGTDIYYLSLDGNAFTGCVSMTYFDPSRITYLDLSRNRFDCIEDFSALIDTGELLRISTWGNPIPFEYLEPNRHVATFNYAPGQNLLDTSAYLLKAGDSITIESGSGGVYTHYQWFHNWAEIPNETSARLVVNDFGMTNEGVYHCVMTNDSLPLLTLRRSPVTLMLEGASGIGYASIQELSFYPNPASDLILVKNLDPGSAIEIFDITGRLLQQAILGADSEINISGLAPGQYCIKAISGTLRHIGRFVKH